MFYSTYPRLSVIATARYREKTLKFLIDHNSVKKYSGKFSHSTKRFLLVGRKNVPRLGIATLVQMTFVLTLVSKVYPSGTPYGALL
jgi:hypothetical protein